MLPLVIVGAPVVVVTSVLYLTLTHPDGLTGSYHRAKKSILAPFVRRAGLVFVAGGVRSGHRAKKSILAPFVRRGWPRLRGWRSKE